MAGAGAAIRSFEGVPARPGLGQIQDQGKARHEGVGAFGNNEQSLNASGGHMPADRSPGGFNQGAGEVKVQADPNTNFGVHGASTT